MGVAGSRFDLRSLTSLHWIAITMALVSALIHLVLGIGFLPHWMGFAFLLASGGFIGGVVLVLLDYRRKLLYLLGIPYTAAQIVLWYALNQPAGLGDIPESHAMDKIAQVILILSLVVLYRRGP